MLPWSLAILDRCEIFCNGMVDLGTARNRLSSFHAMAWLKCRLAHKGQLKSRLEPHFM